MGMNKYSDFGSFEEMAKAEEQETVTEQVSKETDEPSKAEEQETVPEQVSKETDEPTKTE